MTTIKKLIDLKGRRALITGATGELGKVIADTLAELGVDLVLTDIHGSDMDSLSLSLINQWNVKVESHFCDLELQEQRRELIDFFEGVSIKEIQKLGNNARNFYKKNLQMKHMYSQANNFINKILNDE